MIWYMVENGFSMWKMDFPCEKWITMVVYGGFILNFIWFVHVAWLMLFMTGVKMSSFVSPQFLRVPNVGPVHSGPARWTAMWTANELNLTQPHEKRTNWCLPMNLGLLRSSFRFLNIYCRSTDRNAGIADARNVARIVLSLWREGIVPWIDGSTAMAFRKLDPGLSADAAKGAPETSFWENLFGAIWVHKFASIYIVFIYV